MPLCSAAFFARCIRMGHEVHFFERDTPYYASHRDLTSLPSATIHLYSDWDAIRSRREA